jgi:hypothetical protein
MEGTVMAQTKDPRHNKKQINDLVRNLVESIVSLSTPSLMACENDNNHQKKRCNDAAATLINCIFGIELARRRNHFYG